MLSFPSRSPGDVFRAPKPGSDHYDTRRTHCTTVIEKRTAICVALPPTASMLMLLGYRIGATMQHGTAPRRIDLASAAYSTPTGADRG